MKHLTNFVNIYIGYIYKYDQGVILTTLYHSVTYNMRNKKNNIYIYMHFFSIKYNYLFGLKTFTY